MPINKLALSNFRNHYHFQINVDSPIVVINGPNGIGKTNILEALSFLAPGRGLRHASLDQIFPINHIKNTYDEWAVRCDITHNQNSITLSTGSIKDHSNTIKRLVVIDDNVTSKHSDILNYLKVVWLIPQMDGIFMESPSNRRKFIDRITYNFFPEHAPAILNYDKLLKSRLTILHDHKYDEIWLKTLEEQIAHLSCAILIKRHQALNLVQQELHHDDSPFLKPLIKFIGPLDQLYTEKEKGNIIDLIIHHLKRLRHIDATSNRTNFGVHKSDIETLHSIKNIPAHQSSTGEQKSMLTSLILGQVKAMSKINNAKTILLLDEVFAHLDQSATSSLINQIHLSNVQTWLTTTDVSLVNRISVKHNNISFYS
ncbi:DNA replication/repair protein RecF [Rickettsiales endosymbiont of Peranema trichophorum]|uniref:DNA replication/repair protein RecF n=1 Tax=Rickettsiales endosymbiont of Peranema trichophorum TaxID=2486577 RepID=UPI0010234DC7|nr:DNA replication/repair protein RecF [Rickettsiales endosymbiont of Peranema trichophorum]RZI46784.1 DNA replication/repair protein RecF [Rickettsiales endosymbiont of Peranema trichophorum]